MKPYVGKELEACRITTGPMASTRHYGMNGAFDLSPLGLPLNCVVSDDAGWEHVSVTVQHEKRCPTWEEMCRVKNLFWTAHECVVQYHPVKSEYVNHHPHCLHLWKPTNQHLPSPPAWMVGPKG